MHPGSPARQERPGWRTAQLPCAARAPTHSFRLLRNTARCMPCLLMCARKARWVRVLISLGFAATNRLDEAFVSKEAQVSPWMYLNHEWIINPRSRLASEPNGSKKITPNLSHLSRSPVILKPFLPRMHTANGFLRESFWIRAAMLGPSSGTSMASAFGRGEYKKNPVIRYVGNRAVPSGRRRRRSF